MKIDIGNYAAKLESARTELDAKGELEKEEYDNSVKFNQRIAPIITPFFYDLESSLKQLNFTVNSSIQKSHFNLSASIASTDESLPRFTVNLYAGVSGSNAKITATVSFERGHSFFNRLRIWGKEINFLEGASNESHLISELLEFMSNQMSSWVKIALAVAFGPNKELLSSLRCDDKIEVIDEDGNPVQNATIAIIRNDNLFDVKQTNERGTLLLAGAPKDPQLFLVAHPAFKGKASPITGTTTKVILERENGVSSFFATTGWLSVPDFGEIDFIIDSQERMYCYSKKEISINNSSAQPFPVELGKWIHLQRVCGNTVKVALSAASGTCLILDVKSTA